MSLGTIVVSLLLLLVVIAIIKSLIKKKRAGQNLGCGSCTTCVHASPSGKTSTECSSCPTCSQMDELVAKMEASAKDDN